MARSIGMFHLVQRALRKVFSLGGVLGLAISVYFYRRYRRSKDRQNVDGGRGRVVGGPETSRSGHLSMGGPKRNDGQVTGASTGLGEVPGRGDGNSGVSLPQFILSTYKKPSLVVSIPSILTMESGPIGETATAHEPTVEWLKLQLKGHSKFETYLVCQVEDDIGEAVVSAMLEHCGVVPQVVPAHRVLFVEDAKSTVSVVRQLDPGVYIGTEEVICSELRRFYKEPGRIALCRGGGEDVGQRHGKSRLWVDALWSAAC